VRHATVTVITTLVLGGTLLLATGAPAAASGYPDSCGVREAKRELQRAHKALLVAQRREAEARYVLGATRRFTGAYGVDVGRWVQLARDVGWPREQLATLMMVIRRESGGSPKAQNPTSSASGLLQFLSPWWAGKWDPFDPRQNLRHGYLAWKASGWAPWALTAY